MTPWLVRLLRPSINRTLRQKQKIVDLAIGGIEHVKQAIAAGAGVLITPNHSFHYDSYVLIEASHRVGRAFHFLTAWQVFATSTWIEQIFLQRHGCYSINREGTDLAAFKTSVDILREGRHPLVIFPEGDIYHNNDQVTSFQEGATAIAMSAAKKSDRPIVCIPCAIKAFYVDDPSAALEDLMSRLEASLFWRPRTELSLPDRIYRFAEGMLALKEYEYLGEPHSGTVRERVSRLSDTLLTRLETQYGVPRTGGSIPQQVRKVRRAVIKASEQESVAADTAARLADDMDDLFFIVQLFSYPGNYVSQRPSVERIAETLDKFEEDIFHVAYPGVRGARRAVVRFGEPIPVPRERENRTAVESWTKDVEGQVQSLLDAIIKP